MCIICPTYFALHFYLQCTTLDIEDALPYIKHLLCTTSVFFRLFTLSYSILSLEFALLVILQCILWPTKESTLTFTLHYHGFWINFALHQFSSSFWKKPTQLDVRTLHYLSFLVGSMTYCAKYHKSDFALQYIECLLCTTKFSANNWLINLEVGVCTIAYVCMILKLLLQQRFFLCKIVILRPDVLKKIIQTDFLWSDVTTILVSPMKFWVLSAKMSLFSKLFWNTNAHSTVRASQISFYVGNNLLEL